MPSYWFPLLFCLSATQAIRIWISGTMSQPIKRSDMDLHCHKEFPGGRALVCTRDTNVAPYFIETEDVSTSLDYAGATWSIVARRGTVWHSIFGTAKGLLDFINDINGMKQAARISHSCDIRGYYLDGTACDGSYDSNVGQDLVGSSEDISTAWVYGVEQVPCGGDINFYCWASDPITDSPTLPPTLATSAPTRTPTAAPNAAPNAVAPTPAPTATPTLPSPTPAPTVAPTIAPTTTKATAAPNNAPTAPTPAPTAVVTSAPTKAPTCSDCTITMYPGNFSNSTNSSNATFTVGPTGGPPVVVTIPPIAIPNCSNCSVVIVLTPTPSGPRGGSGVLTIDVVDAGLTRPNVTLQVPFTFFMPYSADLVGCSGPVVADCVWRADTEWLNTGCSSQNMGTGTLCTCTHFTDFAVLLDESVPHPCSRPDSNEIFFVLIACYALLFLYCVLAVSRLFYMGAKLGRGVMLLQHSLIGAVCVLRILSCLNYLRVFGDAMGLSAFVAAAPYPLEYLLFTKFASTWAGLVHFSMLSTEARWKKIRPLFYSINAIGTCLAVGLFVMFYVESSFESALAGTVVLALLYLALATAFSVYASKLVKELAKASKSSSATSGGVPRRCGVETKIQLIGHLAAACFVVQALCSVLALALPSEQLVGWTATFCFFNIVALLCILVVYSAAVLKAPKATPRHTDVSYTSSGAQSSQPTK